MNKKMVVVLAALGGAAVIGLKTAPQFYRAELELPQEIDSAKEFIVGNSMTIVHHKGIWSSHDDDFYPVDNDKVENLLSQFKSAAINSSVCQEMPVGSADIVLKTASGSDVALFYAHGSEPIQRVEAVQNGRCFELEGTFNIPEQPYQWFRQPLFPFSDSDTEEIYGIDPSRFSFSELVFYQASRSNDFEEWDKRKIKVTTSGGVVIDMTVYAYGHSYWLSVSLKTSPMPSIKADNYIKNNGFLFDGWYFELPQPEGNRLFDNNDSQP